MTVMNSRVRSVCLALTVAVSSFGVVHAHEEDAFEADDSAGWTTAEKKSAHEQVLAMTAIKQLAAINQGLNDLVARDPSVCNWMNQITGPETLARQVRAFDTSPAIKGVIEAARMTVREYLLTLHAVSETAVAVHASEQQMEATATASSANVTFYRRNRAEIERLLDGPDPC